MVSGVITVFLAISEGLGRGGKREPITGFLGGKIGPEVEGGVPALQRCDPVKEFIPWSLCCKTSLLFGLGDEIGVDLATGKN